MLFEHNSYSSPLLLGFVHALLFGAIFLAKSRRENSLSDRMMAVYLTLAALSLGPYMLGFAGWYSPDHVSEKRFMYYAPMIQGLAIPPLHFFYVKSLTEARFRFKKADFWHFLPAFLWVAGHLAYFVFDYFLNGKRGVDAQMSSRGDVDYDPFYQFFCLFSTVVYFSMAFKIWRTYEKNIYDQTSIADSIRLGWLRNFNVSTLVLTVVFFAWQVLGELFQIAYIDSFWFYALQVGLLFYLTVAGFSASVSASASAAFSSKNIENAAVLIENEPFEVEKAKTIDPDWLAQLDAWKPKVQAAMIGDRLFLESELSLADLAERLRTNPSQLSKIINQGFGQNFNDFVNAFRVEEFERKKADPNCSHLSLMGLAFESGFNSKATFNRVFRKLRGRAPSEI